MLKNNILKIGSIMLTACMLISWLSACGSETENTDDTKATEDSTENNNTEDGAALFGSFTQNKVTLRSDISTEYNLDASADISEDTKFNSVILSLTAEDFNENGIYFGDSCDIAFSNGYSLTDVPYYNGYYVKTGDPVIVAYPKNQYVLITNNNRGMWTEAGLSSDITVEITLNTAGKYKATYEALGQDYSIDRNEYDSDIQFANFRALQGGNLKKDLIYRGASPVDNSRNRASYADKLIKENGINCIIDLADSTEDMEGYIASTDFKSDYARSLYESGKTILLSMSSNYDAQSYKESVASGLRHMLKCGGPVYIHCMEGKDRTGFVCLLLEALAGASYEEMCNDYMTTYDNYYKITKENTPERYEAVVSLYFDAFMEYLYGTDDIDVLKSADYTDAAKDYLKACGMSDDEIISVISFMTE